MTWVLIIWSAIIIVWAVAGGASGAQHCAQQTGDQFLSRSDAQNACDAGTGLGIAIILFIGFVGFVFFSIIWFMTRPKGRDCPVCGNLVKRGLTTCPSCGYDFAAAVAGGVGIPRSRTPAAPDAPQIEATSDSAAVMGSQASAAPGPRLAATPDSLIAQVYKREKR
jgi:hypothetical protein